MNAMTLSLGESADIRLSLNIDQTASTKEALGMAIECLRGSLWITFERGGQDYVLNPGERLPISQPGRMVMQALAPSEVVFLRQPESKAVTASTISRASRNSLEYPAECWRNFVGSRAIGRINFDSPF